MEVYVARQPIFDINESVIGYELLYRNSLKNAFDVSVAADRATATVIVNSYFSFGIERLVRDKKAFINFDRQLLLQDIPYLLAKDKIVIELLENMIFDEILVNKIKQLRQAGYLLALDDYVLGQAIEPIIDQIDILKVDFMANERYQIEEIYRLMKERDIILLAEKVETREAFEWAKKLGYTHFQGYFFSKPHMLSRHEVKYISPQYLQIMQEMSMEEPDYRKITRLIEMEPLVAYRLLKLVNTSYSRVNTITSIQQALAMLGVGAFRKWFGLVMLQTIGDNPPTEIIKLGMQRARFLELLLQKTNKTNFSEKEEIMLVGILSVLDSLLNRSMNSIVKELPLDDRILDTLQLEKSDYLGIYKIMLNYERMIFENEGGNHQPSDLDKIYYQAVDWAEETYYSSLDDQETMSQED